MLRGRIITRVLDDAFPRAERQVQPAKLGVPALKVLDNAQRVQIVVESQSVFAQSIVESAFARMPEGRMANVMDQRQRFCQPLVQAQHCCYGARDLRHLHRVGQAAAEVVRVAVREYLRLAGKTAEGPRVNNPSAVALKWKPVEMG